ncbi:tRNA (N6-threonylcarbamoyladenosine(37)-N6)-methyltransferase TrmO [Candidatus Neomarinimicrobiota bacterium]
MYESITYRVIGRVENAFSAQMAAENLLSAESRIIMDPALQDGLLGLEPGQRIAVIFHFHRARGFELRQHPRGDKHIAKRGVFTLRSPRRPNHIGLSVVDLIGLKDNVLRVQGLDALNGTPVLDIKPA